MAARSSGSVQARRPRRAQPTARGWALLAVGAALVAAAILLARSDLLLVGVVLLAVPLLSLLALGASRPRLEVSRRLSAEAAPVGSETTVTLELRNLSRHPTAAMRWRDRRSAEVDGPGRLPLPSLRGQGEGHGRRLLGDALGIRGGAGAEEAVLRYRARPTRRGAFPLGPLVVLRSDPLGLACVETALGGSGALLATPRVSDLSRAALDATAPEGAAQQLLRPALVTADDVIAREWRPGDPWRRMHWGATARRDRLMVRQEEDRSNPQAWILYDTAVHGTPRGRGEPFERATELVASIASYALGLGYAVGVVETGLPRLSGRSASLGGLAGAVFEAPNGAHALIVQLATIEQGAPLALDAVPRFASALRRAGAIAPGFVVLVDGPAEIADELVTARALCEPAVAFLTTPAAQAAEPMLRAAGWTCVDVVPGMDPAAAWAWAGSAQGGHG